MLKDFDIKCSKCKHWERNCPTCKWGSCAVLIQEIIGFANDTEKAQTPEDFFCALFMNV